MVPGLFASLSLSFIFLAMPAFAVPPSSSHSPRGVASPAPSTSPSPAPSASPSPAPSASPSPEPTVSPSPLPSLSRKELETLYREYQRAQKQELEALEHRQKLETKELNAAQKQEYKNWMKEERIKRKEALRGGYGGKIVKAYVQDFTQRREGLWTAQKAEKQTRKTEQESRKAALREEQSRRLKQFKEALDRGKRPSMMLWPSLGR